MDKRFLGMLIGAVVVLVGVFFLTTPKKADTSHLESNGNLNSIQPYDHVRGDKDSKVVLIEYGDFQCPYCGAYFPFAEEANNRYGSVVAFVYRSFPLTQIHPNAMSAARAAEAAAKQDKFWQMHDKLYSNQSDWAENALNASKKFNAYAKELGLNEEQFKSDYTSNDINDRIRTFLDNGKTQNVTGTPKLLLVVDGKSQSLDPPQANSQAQAYFDAIDSALKKADIKIPDAAKKG